MFENFDKKYASITKIFEQLIQNNDFAVPNSIILHGPDVIGQYYFAQLLARGANCTGDKTQNCECQNCRWIKANEHPEVLTVSKINSKPEGDESKTVISKKQTDSIKDKLIISSDYHRFFIFCDAENRELSTEENEKFGNFKFLNQGMPKTVNNSWIPLGLNKKTFQDVVANSLLKSIEEPPSNVTFIFLTDSLQNIISTIISRSQVFYIPGNSKQNYNYNFLIEPLGNYPNIDRNKAIMISDFLMKYSKDNNLAFTDIVVSIQMYLKDLMKNNSKNLILKQQISDDIENLQQALNMLYSSIREQIVADEVGYILTK